jgi:squalene-hopene/tetraprenyl-beta-curcumene cyclase
VCKRGMQFLGTREISASPIGLYFAMLWYDEKLYPLIYYVEALRRYLGKM